MDIGCCFISDDMKVYVCFIFDLSEDPGCDIKKSQSNTRMRDLQAIKILSLFCHSNYKLKLDYSVT